MKDYNMHFVYGCTFMFSPIFTKGKNFYWFLLAALEYEAIVK